MIKPEFIGVDDVSDRSLYLLDVPSIADVPPKLDLATRYFVCLIAADSEDTPREKLSALVQNLVASGCAYLAAWGAGCEALHDIADQKIAELSEDNRHLLEVMTTWHDKEPLSEALWDLLNISWPANPFEEECNAALVICVGQTHWAEQCREALRDPRAFSEKVLADEDR